MDAQLWKTPQVQLVEFLHYEGKLIGTRTHFKNAEPVIDTRYPEVQSYLLSSTRFWDWMNENKILSRKTDVNEQEYGAVIVAPQPDFFLCF